MIFWNKLKIQDNDGTIELSKSGNALALPDADFTGTVTFHNSVTLPAGSSFSGSVTLPSGSSIADVLTKEESNYTLNVTNATIGNAAITSLSRPISLPAGSAFVGATALPAGSTFAGPVDIPAGSTGNFTQISVANPITLTLSEGSTLNGKQIATRGFVPGFWLNAYQGPGMNWINIRNYAAQSLEIIELRFSGHDWKAQPDEGESQAPVIAGRGGAWGDYDYWGWGSIDTPGNIVITYKFNNVSYTETIPASAWTVAGGVGFGNAVGEYPGSILAEDNHTLTISYYSTNGGDVNVWKAYATAGGYGNGVWFGPDGGDSITDTLTGPAILMFVK